MKAPPRFKVGASAGLLVSEARDDLLVWIATRPHHQDKRAAVAELISRGKEHMLPSKVRRV